MRQVVSKKNNDLALAQYCCVGNRTEIDPFAVQKRKGGVPPKPRRVCLAYNRYALEPVSVSL